MFSESLSDEENINKLLQRCESIVDADILEAKLPAIFFSFTYVLNVFPKNTPCKVFICMQHYETLFNTVTKRTSLRTDANFGVIAQKSTKLLQFYLTQNFLSL